ncbi:thylakoid lumenal 17.4 kDa protein, chloroplastic-like [Zingiber officinale]|uniref:thylakoid lumenal 17.4 kDa protein, chloroplastic-like n=1 Tax=Zingiber officinale TaxID=94328 RepID=UPI001C4D4E64|nr:thylakoid lumenal 17.4 kDa protein, chloroplastic-like [Zingiber officinale]
MGVVVREPTAARQGRRREGSRMASVCLPTAGSSISHSRLSHSSAPKPRPQFRLRVQCAATEEPTVVTNDFESDSLGRMKNLACGLLAAFAITTCSPVIAASQRLPPLSTEPDRCERAFVGNTIGQANGVYDKPLDLRFCDYENDKSHLKGKTLSAALMSGAKFDGADMTEVVMSKAYAVGASFKGVDFSNAVLDRVNFGKANLQGAIFKNTVLSGSTFDDAQLEDAVFEDTIIGYIDLQKLCTNTTLGSDRRAELGCK